MKRRLLSLLISGVMAVAMGSVAAQGTSGSVEKAVAKPAGKPGITAEQRSLLNEKFAIVDKLMRAAGANQVGENVSAERQRWMLESMYKMSVTQLRTMRLQGSPDLLANEIAKSAKVTTKAEQPDLGQLTTELTFLPIQPCRYIDTRSVGGPIVGSRQFDLENAGSAYGGSAACTPITTTVGAGNSSQVGAIAANVAIVSPTVAPGFIGARPVGSTNTTALVNWYQAGPSVQASNAGILATDQQVAVTNEIEFFGSPTEIIVDVFGVFAAPTATALNCDTNTATVSVPIGGSFSLAQATCTAGYSRTGGGCNIPDIAGASILSSNPLSTSTWNCAFNQTGTAYTGTSYIICCRTPGR